MIKVLADQALADLSPLFDAMYAELGRPSIPPERLLKASLLISLYSVRSEYAFCEELNYHLLFRWFLGMGSLRRRLSATLWSLPQDSELVLISSASRCASIRSAITDRRDTWASRPSSSRARALRNDTIKRPVSWFVTTEPRPNPGSSRR